MKILILLFVLAISLCLAFACSASEYDFISSYEFSALFDVYGNEYENYIMGEYHMEEIKYLENNEVWTLSMFVVAGAGADTMANTVYSIQPHAFKHFVDTFTHKNGDCTYGDFISAIWELDGIYASNGLFMPEFYRLWMRDNYPGSPSYQGILTEKYFNVLYYYNDELTYSEGYAQGITDFTNSTAYQDTLALEKETGQAEGKDMFMASAEYKAALQKEYDNGYDKALLVSEQKQATNIVSIALGSCGIGLLVLLAVYFISARKKQKRK